MKKIIIRVITYNQEDLIRRALESVLCQKEWGLYRIVISDDCSKDRTWEILQDYQEKYPEIIDIHRNCHNLGIFGNVAQSETYLPSEYDLFGELSGDDAYCEGYFETVQRFIQEHSIDTSEAIGIFSDWKAVGLDGKEDIYVQDAVLSGYNLFSLKARGLISSRSLLVSKKVRDGYEPILQGRGLNLTESHYDSQPFFNIKEKYYIHKVTSIYYTGIGVSTLFTNKQSSYKTTERIEKWNYAIEHLIHEKHDLFYAKSEKIRAEFFVNPSWDKIFKIVYYSQLGQLRRYENGIAYKLKMILSLIKYKITHSK